MLQKVTTKFETGLYTFSIFGYNNIIRSLWPEERHFLPSDGLKSHTTPYAPSVLQKNPSKKVTNFIFFIISWLTQL